MEHEVIIMNRFDKKIFRLFLLVSAFACLTFTSPAQSTEFSYQGNLQSSGTAANGNFDFEFRLFDVTAGGSQIGSTASRNNVVVNSGTFGVMLDFGAASFPGADRWIEVWIRPTGSGGGFQQLLPRTKLASSPYAIQSLNASNATTAANATNLGGVTANQYVVTTDPRMTNARTPTAGSADYIQNQNAAAQAASNFSISGNGTVGGTLSGNTLNATTQLNINGLRAFTINGPFSSPGFALAPSNTFAGAGAGINTTPDPSIGSSLGKKNSFFGVRAGIANVTGDSNSFFGTSAGEANTNGFVNAFFGLRAGESNTGGDDNSFFGALAGTSNTFGEKNTFIGRGAGASNILGDNNTALGHSSNVSEGLQYATAIGASSAASLSNSIYLGRPGGEDTVRIPGNLNVTGSATINGNFIQASGGLAVFNSPVRLASISTGGETALCRRNADGIIATCGSSLRYKTNITRFGQGLDLVRQLNPITFDWKDGGMHDLGLGAEDVAAIEPLLVTYNAMGEVEGVKYDRIGIVLVNAVKEQQAQIEKQREELSDQRKLIAELKSLVCSNNSTAAVCKGEANTKP